MARKPLKDRPLIDQFLGLEVGESLSHSKRFTIEQVSEGKLRKSIASMRGLYNQVASRIRKNVDINLRVESGIMLTDDQLALIATVVITRLSNGNDDDGLDI